MPLLMLRDVPPYDCLFRAAEQYPSLDPKACEAFFHLLRTGDAVSGQEAAFLNSHGISHGRFTVLMLLHHACDERQTPATLAEEAGVARATMTGLVDTLEKDGLVHRDADPSDRRTVQVCLTTKGRQTLEQILPGYFQQVSSMIQVLDRIEQNQLVGLLQKVQLGLAISQDATTSIPN